MYKMFLPVKFVKMICFNFSVAVLLLLIIFVLCKKNEELKGTEDPLIIHWALIDNNIACHSSVEGDALQSIEDPSFQPKSKSIFFHETSCRGGLDSRKACAVESAAKAHPDWDVHVLFSSPVKDLILKKTCIAKLHEYPNVKLARVYADSFSKNTVVHSIVTKTLFESRHPIEHTADIMRILTLNKWGGIYLDLDQIVVRPFDSLPHNWIAKETATEFATGVMAFSKDEIGQNITNSVLQEIFDTYNPTSWSNSRSLAIERVLLRRCQGVTKTYGNCGGVSIFSHELFYPIHYSWAHLYFQADGFKTKFQEPYTHHLWNSLTKEYGVHPNSPYAELARKHCPKIYHMHGKDFGI